MFYSWREIFGVVRNARYGAVIKLRSGLFVFFDFSVAHTDHAVGMQSNVRLVRHEYNCVAALVQACEKRHNFIARGGIKISRGLVR